MAGKTRMGLEVHVELNTKTKLFCSCPRTGSTEPNTRVCPVCLGHPGAKPFLNKRAVELAEMACLVLNSGISDVLEFSRKSYFYPDLAKNFQITQHENPIGTGGWIDIGKRKIMLKRIHIEEDPASISYPSSPKESKHSLIDYNRSGNPLIEIVTEPWDGDPSEAKLFLRKLMDVLEYIGVFDPETGIIKSDVNVSVEESGFRRVEIKNVTGFREAEKAIAYESARQRNMIRFGQAIENETRGWDPVSGTTYLLRKKESEDDYAYIPEPNIPPIELDNVEGLKGSMPELPWERADRFVRQYSISRDMANALCSSFRLSELFESTALKFPGRERDVAKWVRNEAVKVMNYKKKSIREFPEGRFEKILGLLFSGEISDTLAKEMIKSIFDREPEIPSSGNIEMEVENAITSNGTAVKDFLAGNEKALDFIVGQIMRNHPEFDARRVRKLLFEKLRDAE